MDSPLPLVLLEAVPSAGKRTLLDQWSREERASGYRVVIDIRSVAADGPGLLRIVWAALATDLPLPHPPDDDDQLLGAALRAMRDVHAPIAVGLLGADNLDADTVDYLLQLCGADQGPRLVVSGIDLVAVADAVRARQVPFHRLGDQDMSLSVDEIRELMSSHGFSDSREAAAAVRRATLGLPGAILAALDVLPHECATGVITSDRAMAAYLGGAPAIPQGIPFTRFVGTMLHVFRFSVPEAIAISGSEAAAEYLHRMQSLGLGRMVWSRTLHERVFRWHPSMRAVLGSALSGLHPVEPDMWDRAVAVTTERGDHALLAATLVGHGDLEGAEQALQHLLWDVLPNGPHQLWESLRSFGPAALREFPSLLCVRLRVCGALRSSPAVRVASTVGTALAQATLPSDPWRRLGNLARAIELARYSPGADLAGPAVRARDLIADLGDDAVPASSARRAISDLLMIASALLRAGDVTAAAGFAAHALHLCEHDPAKLDPFDQRIVAAQLMVLLSYRERGLEDPVDGEQLLAGPSRLWRDTDVLAAQLCLMWDDLDREDLEAADTRCRAAADTLLQPGDWPSLLHAQLRMAVLTKRRAEIGALLEAYDRVRPGESGSSGCTETAPADAYSINALGRSVPAARILPGDGSLPARSMHAVHLQRALDAVRASRPGVARAELERACAVSPRRGLAPLALAGATSGEVRALEQLMAGHCNALRLHLGFGYRIAASDGEPTVELSEREREVLGHLRAGLKNEDIAAAMFLSANTVKFHRARLMRKLGASSRHEALEIAASLGL